MSMKMRVTIDSNILIRACADVSWDHIALLKRVQTRGCGICLDHEDEIMKEYRNKLSGVEAFEKWCRDNLESFEWCNGKLPHRHIGRLTCLGCHEPSDHVFIAVSLNSGRILFTEDSDMGKGPNGKIPPHDQALEYLEQELGLTVCDCGEANQLLE